MSQAKKILDNAIEDYLEARREESAWKTKKDKAGKKIKRIMDLANRYTYNSRVGRVTYPKATKTTGYKKDILDALVESGQIPEEVIEQAITETPSRRLDVALPKKRGPR